jgi:hypothetical protein
MTKAKLGKQLTLLGYPSETKLVSGKKARVRLGLSMKRGQSTTFNEGDGGTHGY